MGIHDSLSKYWAETSHRALVHAPDRATKLALALTPVRSVIRVIDDHTPPMTVDWASVNEQGRSISATNFATGHIIVNPLPITEGHLGDAAALDVVTGFAMHEASHGKHSRDRYKYLLKTERFNPGGQSGGSFREREVPAFSPMRIAAYLWNLVEDVRIEAETAKEWRGTAAYFRAVLAYMWKHIESTTHLLATDNPHPALTTALQTVFVACRYPDRAAARLGPSQAPEVAWWQAWQADYLSNAVDTPTTIQRGLDHLALDEKVQKEMEGLSEQERKEQVAGERARAQLERLMQEGVEGTVMVCINEDGEVVPLDAETAAKVDQLVREGLIEMRPIVTANGAANPPLHVRKPEETGQSRHAYLGKPDAESEALRTALVFRAAVPQYDIKLLRQGVLDDEELWRLPGGDYRVFGERVVETKPDVFMGLLVDLSGSMNDGYKLKNAQRLAQLFVWALHDQEGVETQVWGHTGDSNYGRGSSVEIFRLWEQHDPLSRLGLIGTIDHANNFDGHALAYVARQVLDQPQPQKVVVVLSDGIPSGNGYGGERGMQHVREVAEWARHEGCAVIQIAIDSDLRMQDQAKMYGLENVIPFKSTVELPKQLARLMARFS